MVRGTQLGEAGVAHFSGQMQRRRRKVTQLFTIFTSEPVGRSESTDDIRPYKILEILTHGDQTSMVIEFIEVTELEFDVRNDL